MSSLPKALLIVHILSIMRSAVPWYRFCASNTTLKVSQFTAFFFLLLLLLFFSIKPPRHRTVRVCVLNQKREQTVEGCAGTRPINEEQGDQTARESGQPQRTTTIYSYYCAMGNCTACVCGTIASVLTLFYFLFYFLVTLCHTFCRLFVA